MKTRILILLIALLLTNVKLEAAYYSYLAYSITQPDNKEVKCFVSGDEFYNWLHDQDGYTIIQAADGYYYYGISDGTTVQPSKFKAGEANPSLAGLEKWVKISETEYKTRRTSFEQAPASPNRAPSAGTLNNIVVYIRFSDDTEFTNTRQFFDDKFNLVTGVSLLSYYSEVSYNQLSIPSTHYPECAMTTNLSYTDNHQRNYFQPYNATTNPAGYANESERTIREHTLLNDAITWINLNSPVPAGLNIDGDNDGNADNVCFNIRGSNGAWSSLLWAHSWSLFSYNTYINGKRVWKYTFQPETQLDVKTLCHEMFHALGAPDLYHYSSNGIQPAQSWDLMEQGFGHMGAYMKWRYSNYSWITSIPEITSTGTYTLNPLSSATNNCFKIKSPNSLTEFFIVEYRKKTGAYEVNVPGSGLIVYRINSSYYGNAYGPPDEVYIYRPNGTITSNGNPSQAFYSSTSGRTGINDTTNPCSFLQSGNAGGLNISGITEAGSTISFTVTINTVEDPLSFTAMASGTSEIDLQWQKNTSNNNIMLAVSNTSVFGNPLAGSTYSNGSVIPGGGTVIYNGSAAEFVHSGLNTSTTYYYKLYSVNPENNYSFGLTQNATTFCNTNNIPYSSDFPSQVLPSCWATQQSPNATNNWVVSNSTMAGGSGFEMKSTYQSANPAITRLVILPLNTLGMTQLNLSFIHKLDDYAPGATLRIQSSTDGVNWINEAWMLATASNSNIGPETVNTIITSNLNSEYTYIAFTIEGNHFQFDYWYIDNVSITNAGSQSYSITAAVNPIGAGTVNGVGTYVTGQTVTVSGTPNTGWNFLNWTENGVTVCSEASYSFTAAANRQLQAEFSMNQVSISTNANPVSGGTITGGGTYQVSMPVTLVAQPNEGYQFISWTESGIVISTSPTYSFTAIASRCMTANFEVQQFTIHTASVPESGGTTSGDGIYTYHELVTVIATVNPEWEFAGWYENGILISANEVYTFAAASDRNLEANFTVSAFTISLSASPDNGGTVSGGGVFTAGCQVTAIANAAADWTFINWTESGEEVSTEPQFIFTVDCNRNLQANFLPVYEISATDLPTTSGYTTGSGLYIEGDTVTLTAYANDGYTFTGWTENNIRISGESVYQFIASENRILVANFLNTVGLNETAASGIIVYPNPSSGIVHISQSGTSESTLLEQIEVFNSFGKMVLSQQPETSAGTTDVDLQGMAPGTYIMRLALKNEETQVIKIVLKQ